MLIYYENLNVLPVFDWHARVYWQFRRDDRSQRIVVCVKVNWMVLPTFAKYFSSYKVICFMRGSVWKLPVCVLCCKPCVVYVVSFIIIIYCWFFMYMYMYLSKKNVLLICAHCVSEKLSMTTLRVTASYIFGLLSPQIWFIDSLCQLDSDWWKSEMFSKTLPL